MNDKYFIDTNILVYSFDGSIPEKKARSLSLIAEALKTGNGMISWQVIQEFLNVAIHKFLTPLGIDDSHEYLQKVLFPLCQIFPDNDIYLAALSIQGSLHFRFYDSLIISSALHGGCTILYSEDFQPGQLINNMRIVNPFQS